MIKITHDIIKYFQVQHRDHSFWVWASADDKHGRSSCEIIEWIPTDRSTICYRDELVDIIAQLRGHQAPPLGCILLLLSACRAELNKSQRYFLHAIQFSLSNTEEGTKLRKEAERLLDMVSALPEELRTGANKVHLLNELFEDFYTRDSYQYGAYIKKYLQDFSRGDWDQQILSAESINFPREHIMQQFEVLADIAKRYESKELLAVKLRTGISEAPDVSKVSVPVPESAPVDLLEALSQDPFTAALARLTRKIISVLNIPTHSQGSGEMPYGGLSDITNRGNYDRLLLSELAQDELLLMARLVNSEALYYRREEPPQNPKRQRTLLVDTTLKMWGVPRVFAMASALAFIHNSKHKELIESYALKGETHEDIDLSSKEGVLHALSVMDPALHAGQSMQALITDRPASDQNEYILITGSALFNSHSFQLSLAGIREELRFIITVNRNGALQFYECNKGISRLLNTAKLDLEELLFAKETPSTQWKRPTNYKGWIPSFISQAVPPLLFPKVKIRWLPGRMFHVGEKGMVVIDQFHRVIYLENRSRGAFELMPVIERGHYLVVDGGGMVFIVVYNADKVLGKIYYRYLPGSGYTTDKVLDIAGKLGRIKNVAAADSQFYIDCEKGFFSLKPGWPEEKDTVRISEELYQFKVNLARQEEAENRKRPINIMLDQVTYKLNKLYVTHSYVLGIGSFRLNMRERFQVNLNRHAMGFFLDPYDGAIINQREAVRGDVEHLVANKEIDFSYWKWEDGSEAFVDHRGILHLKSADPSLPEISILLLVNNSITLWASDNAATGNREYIPTHCDIMHEKNFHDKYILPFIDRILKHASLSST
jgi:hypothetical protein